MDLGRFSLVGPDQRKARGVSPYLARSIRRFAPDAPTKVLDIPCGFGRHSFWLADLGFEVIAADIDRDRLSKFSSSSKEPVVGSPITVQLDAERELPFGDAAFGIAIVIDFVSPTLLQRLARVLEPAGLLVFETMSARGGNWKQLPFAGATRAQLQHGYEIVDFAAARVGLAHDPRETIKATARRR